MDGLSRHGGGKRAFAKEPMMSYALAAVNPWCLRLWAAEHVASNPTVAPSRDSSPIDG